MIVNNSKNSGFSLVEVLFATLLFSIVILGLAHYQQSIIRQHEQFYQRLQANQIAFQLLESYPHFASHLVPRSWQYEVSTTNYTSQCQWVLISIILPNNQRIQQKRLICH